MPITFIRKQIYMSKNLNDVTLDKLSLMGLWCFRISLVSSKSSYVIFSCILALNKICLMYKTNLIVNWSDNLNIRYYYSYFRWNLLYRFLFLLRRRTTINKVPLLGTKESFPPIDSCWLWQAFKTMMECWLNLQIICKP